LHYGISPQSKHIDISAALVKFMTGPVGAKIYYQENRQLPARIELLNTLPEYTKPPQQIFAEGSKQIGMPRIGTPGYTEYQQVFNQFLTDVAQTDAPIDQLADDRVRVRARRGNPDRDGPQVLGCHVGPQRMAVENDDGARLAPTTEGGHPAHDIPPPVVAPHGAAPGAQHIIAVDQVGHSRVNILNPRVMRPRAIE